MTPKQLCDFAALAELARNDVTFTQIKRTDQELKIAYMAAAVLPGEADMLGTDGYDIEVDCAHCPRPSLLTQEKWRFDCGTEEKAMAWESAFLNNTPPPAFS